MTILALDLSKRRAGWATWTPGTQMPRFGHWVLGSEYTSDGGVYLKLHRELDALHKVFSIEAVYVEQPLTQIMLKGHTNVDVLRILAGIAAHVHSFAEARGWRGPHEINNTSWRRGFIGPQKRGTKRQTLKTLTIERCRQLGLSPRCDDEADALGVLDYALDFHEHITPPWRADEVLRPPLGVST